MNMERNNLQALESKLNALLTSMGLTGDFSTEQYQITYTIRSKENSQTSLLADNFEGFDPDAELSLVFENGDVMTKIIGRVSIPEDDMSKIKGLIKKIHYAFLQVFYLEHEEMLRTAEERSRKAIEDRIVHIYETTVGDICLLRPERE